MDNKFSTQQSEWAVPWGHNTLSKTDFITILNSSACNKETADVYFNRMILIVGICFGIRFTALAELTLNHFKSGRRNGKNVNIFRAKVGSRNGASKRERGSRSMVGKRPIEILVWHVPVLDGALKAFVQLNDYTSLHRTMQLSCNRFFFAQGLMPLRTKIFSEVLHSGRIGSTR